MRYKNLNEKQISNLLYNLKYCGTQDIDLLKEKYFKELKKAKSKESYIDNMIYALMNEDIDLDSFHQWISHINLHQNNSLYVFNLKNISYFKSFHKSIPKKISQSITYLYNISSESLNKIELINISLENDKIIFSFLLPSEIVIKPSSANSESKIEKEYYFAYIWIDLKSKNLIISLPSKSNLISVNNHTVPRNSTDKIMSILKEFFHTNIHKLDFAEQNWVLNVMRLITEEYFDHNNPLISKQKESFEKNESNDIIDLIAKKYNIVNNDVSKKRLQRSLLEIFENELLNLITPVPKSLPFDIFLQEVDKGITQFKADNGSNAFNTFESRQIILKMLENGSLTSLGLSYKYDTSKKLNYKIFASKYYFTLKRLNTGFTRKEIVDDVLSELNEYKQRVQSSNKRGDTKSN